MYIIQPLLLFMCLFCLTPPSSSEHIKQLGSFKGLSSNLMTDGADICLTKNKKEETYLLIVVNSLSYNVEDRQRTRVTWRHHWATRENNVRVVFFVDKPKNWVQAESLASENDIYRDIVWSNVTANSEYSALKSVAWLKWAAERCPRAKFVMKIEEKVVVNLPAVFQFLRQNSKVGNTIWGSVIRNGVLKWIEKLLFNPDYCIKNAYLMSGDVVKKLYKGAIKNIRYVPMENVYLTGYVAKNERIELANNDAFIEMDLPSTYDSDDVILPTDKCSSIENNFIFQTTDDKEVWIAQWSYLLLGLTNCHLKEIDKVK